MALEDFCGLWDNEQLRSPKSLLWPLEDLASSTSTSLSGQRRSDPPLHLAISPTTSPPHHHHMLPVGRPFPLAHGTTTLAFVFRDGVMVAADTRASAGGLVASPSVNKILNVHSHLVATTSGGGADCSLWTRALQREVRLYQLRHGRLLSVRGVAKLLALMLHPFKGTDVCVALTLCGWDQRDPSHRDGGDWGSARSSADATVTEAAPSHVPQSLVSEPSSSSSYPSSSSSSSSTSPAALCPATALSTSSNSYSASAGVGPKVIYVCSDGSRLQGEVFSVGSGSPYAYGILDGGLRWTLSREEAASLAREAVFRATHRDAYSGNNVDLVCVTESGWSRSEREDLKEEYYTRMEEMGKIVEERRRNEF
ncbi:hypothetical protein NHX12_004542 [Muraenolepis orangiensis]|uniref:Proteasome endopeptidase complex n=1 Tax=Muraenolepis orangiensis TaxID=630683 RepID=A0A9Q0DVP3_9TELE|nr:hypothetical protein NHX12_004542 [Muraenolepis orangiensis]